MVVTFNKLFTPEGSNLPVNNGDQTLKSFATGSETTLYTVPTGKVFYITHASVNGRSTGTSTATDVNIQANSNVICAMTYHRSRAETSAGSFIDVIGWSPVQKNFSTPVKITAGQTITTDLNGVGTDQIYFFVVGWEESAN